MNVALIRRIRGVKGSHAIKLHVPSDLGLRWSEQEIFKDDLLRTRGPNGLQPRAYHLLFDVLRLSAEALAFSQCTNFFKKKMEVWALNPLIRLCSTIAEPGCTLAIDLPSS